ncbi:glycoside hydrolase family 65 protein [Bounagaea algeriensis]
MHEQDDAATWRYRWQGLNIEALQRLETMFALSNGHIGLRGTLDEGEPRGIPGTYLNGFHEEYPLPYAESGYGYPESGQTMINVTDGKIIRLLVGDELLDLRYGQTEHHERVLDFRTGTLRRTTDWTSPTGTRVRIRSERLVSFTQRAVSAICYEVEPLDEELQLVVQSDLLANEPIESGSTDPRVAAAMQHPLAAEFYASDHERAVLVHRTSNSGLRMAAAMDHEIDAPAGMRKRMHVEDDLARMTVAVDVPRGQRLRLKKYLGYGWSSQRSIPALRSQVEAALTGALQTGWEGLLSEQRQFLDDFWESADVRIEGDDTAQQAVRFALFELLQAGARGESRSIPAKGLTGTGYDGHAFWETETFVLPVLTYTMPGAARDALFWRYSTLDKARHRAAVLRQEGAAFPWRSINGAECSAYWPASTAAMHVNADVADAVARYVHATGDTQFDRDYGAEMLVETARLWRSLGHFDTSGAFRIDGVTGPDEYTAIVDNNAYTNLMAQRNLREALRACDAWPSIAEELAVSEAERAEWHRAAEAMRIPRSEAVGVHAQADGFTEQAEWDFDGTPAQNYPLLLNYPYFDLYRKQVVKQADLVLAMHLRGDAFTPTEKASNFAYYEARTVRDSSLSSPTQGVLAAEVGHLDLAYWYLVETMLTDMEDIHGNVRNGLHIGALAGVWMVLVAGFGGMRDHDGQITFAPRLPANLDAVSFGMRIRGCRLVVEITQETATYSLLGGESLEITHHGQPVTVDTTSPRELPIPAVEHETPTVVQPPGKEPRERARR